MDKPYDTLQIQTRLPYSERQNNALTWTCCLYILIGLGIALLFSSHTLDQYFWIGTSQCLGALSILIGIPSAIGASIVLKTIALKQQDHCPRCQWGLSQISTHSRSIWLGCQLLQVGCLLTLCITIILGEVHILWYWEYEESLFSWTFLLYTGYGLLICYLLSTGLYLYLATKVEQLSLQQGPSNLPHVHRSPILNSLCRALTGCRS